MTTKFWGLQNTFSIIENVQAFKISFQCWLINWLIDKLCPLIINIFLRVPMKFVKTRKLFRSSQNIDAHLDALEMRLNIFFNFIYS